MKQYSGKTPELRIKRMISVRPTSKGMIMAKTPSYVITERNMQDF